jgi:hypothetical protein
MNNIRITSMEKQLLHRKQCSNEIINQLKQQKNSRGSQLGPLTSKKHPFGPSQKDIIDLTDVLSQSPQKYYIPPYKKQQNITNQPILSFASHYQYPYFPISSDEHHRSTNSNTNLWPFQHITNTSNNTTSITFHKVTPYRSESNTEKPIPSTTTSQQLKTKRMSRRKSQRGIKRSTKKTLNLQQIPYKNLINRTTTLITQRFGFTADPQHSKQITLTMRYLPTYVTV